MAVVDKDGRQLRIGVQRGGNAADIPAVTGGDKRQQANGGVLGRVQRARSIGGRHTHGGKRHWVDGIGHCPGDQTLLGEIEGDIVANGAVGKPHLVAGDAVGDLYFHVRYPQPRGVIDQLIGLAQDADIRGGARSREISRCLGAGQRQVIAEDELLNDKTLALVQVHRAGVDLAGGAGGIDGAEQSAVGRIHDHYFFARSAAQRNRSMCRLRGELLRRMRRDGHGEPAALAAAQQARLGQLVNHILGAPGGNRGIIQRLFYRGAIDMAEEDIRIGRVEYAGLHGPTQQCLRVVDQIGIHRLVAGDEHYERALPAAAGAPCLLPKACDGPRETGRDHGIETSDVDAQLEGGGGGDTEQGGVIKRALQLAAVLGQVTSAIGGDALGKIGPAKATGEHLGRTHGHDLGRAARTHKGHGARALGDEGGHHLGRLGGGGAAHRSPVLALGPLDKTRFP